ncbi:trace amine-associated receptor 13c-like [Acanthopagrus schlegelii]
METLKAADLCIPLNTSCRSMPVTPRSMVIKTLLSFISVLTVVLNLLVIISISHFRQLQTSTNLILLSLAVSDLLVGLVVMPAQIILMHSCTLLDKLSCAVFYLFSFILTSASVGNMVLISVDRYVAICYPLRYSSMITPRRVQIYLSLCWFCSVTYNFMLLKDYLSQIDLLNSCLQECFLVINYIFGAVDLLVTFFCPLTVIIVLYMRVFVVAVSQARVMRSSIAGHDITSYILEGGQVRPDPVKVQAVMEWPQPNSRKQIQRFLGFANFYTRFMRNYSQVLKWGHNHVLPAILESPALCSCFYAISGGHPLRLTPVNMSEPVPSAHGARPLIVLQQDSFIHCQCLVNHCLT